MWLLAFALFFACKAITWVGVIETSGGWRRRLRGSATMGRTAAYFVGWPGMDPVAFLRPRVTGFPPVARWIAALLRIVAGATLIWGIVPNLPPEMPLLAGWVGMVGLILMLPRNATARGVGRHGRPHPDASLRRVRCACP